MANWEQIKQDIVEATTEAPANVREALLVLLDYAKTEEHEPIEDHVDLFVPIAQDVEACLDVSLVIRNY